MWRTGTWAAEGSFCTVREEKKKRKERNQNPIQIPFLMLKRKINRKIRMIQNNNSTIRYFKESPTIHSSFCKFMQIQIDLTTTFITSYLHRGRGLNFSPTWRRWSIGKSLAAFVCGGQDFFFFLREERNLPRAFVILSFKRSSRVCYCFPRLAAWQ